MKLEQLKSIGEIFDYSSKGYALQKIVLSKNKPVDFIFLDVNQSFEKITGLKRRDLIDKKVTDVIPNILNDKFDWVKAYGEVALKQTKKSFIQYSEILGKWFDVSAYSPKKGYFVAVFTDITDLKLNELRQKEITDEYYSLNEEYQAQNEELQSLLDEVSEHKENLEKSNTEIVKQRDEINTRQLFLTSILESTADGILVTGKNGRIDYANQQFYDMWKIPVQKRPASHYKDFYDVVMPQLSNSQQFLEEIEALRQARKTEFGILSFKDGRVFERYSKPIISKGKVIGSIWSFRDITEKRRNEARLKDVNKILYGLKAINHIQSEISDRNQLIHEVCNVVVDTMGFSSAMINLFENNKFVAGAQKGFDNNYQDFKNKLKNNHSFYCYAKNQGKKILIIDKPEKICKDCPLAGLYDENVIYSIPIIYQGHLFGFFNVNINKRYKDDADFQQLFKDVANELAFTLHKIELEEKTKKYLQELKKREQSLRSIFRSSPVGIGVVKNRILTQVNQRFCEIIGYSKEELIGESALKLYPTKEEFEFVGNEKYRQIAENGIGSVETKFKCKDGSIIDVFLSSTPIDADDLSKGVTFSALNISESKKNEAVKDILLSINQESNVNNDIREFAQKTQKELSRIFDTSNFYIGLYNSANDTYTFPYHVDQYDDFDYVEKEYHLPDSLTDFVRRESKPFIVDSATEKELYKKNQITFYGQDSAVWMGAPLTDTKGNAFGVIAIQSYDNEQEYSNDDLKILNYVAQNLSRIIEKIQSENDLKESEEKYRNLVQNIGDGIIIVDLKENILFCNPVASKIFGLKDTELVGKNLSEFVDKQRFELIKNETKKRRRGEKSVYEMVINRPDHRKRYLQVNATPMYKDGKIIGNLGIIRDETERKKYEQQIKQKNEELQAAEEELQASNEELHFVNQSLEQNNKELKKAKEKAESADRLKTAFLANMSHEIRTPMNSILGFSQLLKEKKSDKEKQERFIDIININGKQLITIIDDIIDFSKIESNQLEIVNYEVDIHKMLDDIYESFANKIETEKPVIHFELIKPDGKKLIINTDEQRITQIISNLLGNAIKFTSKGKILLGCEKHEDHLLFFVKDTGIGIAGDKKEIIFERFRQADDSYTRKFGGTGLGLTICKKLTELLGGEIGVESVLGSGSKFYFTIPVR